MPFLILLVIVLGILVCEFLGAFPTFEFKSLFMLGLDRQVKLLG